MDTISPPGHSQAEPPRRYTRRYREWMLALSDEREQWDRRLLAAERVTNAERERWFRAGYRAGYCRQFGDSIPWDWDWADAAVSAAERWAAEDARLWERAFLRRAWKTPADQRTAQQAAALALYGPRR